MLAVNDAVHVVKDMGLASLASLAPRMHAVNVIVHVVRDDALAPLASLGPLRYVCSAWPSARGQR